MSYTNLQKHTYMHNKIYSNTRFEVLWDGALTSGKRWEILLYSTVRLGPVMHATTKAATLRIRRGLQENSSSDVSWINRYCKTRSLFLLVLCWSVVHIYQGLHWQQIRQLCCSLSRPQYTSLFGDNYTTEQRTAKWPEGTTDTKVWSKICYSRDW
jgi:hypothetical protein